MCPPLFIEQDSEAQRRGLFRASQNSRGRQITGVLTGLKLLPHT